MQQEQNPRSENPPLRLPPTERAERDPLRLYSRVITIALELQDAQLLESALEGIIETRSARQPETAEKLIQYLGERLGEIAKLNPTGRPKVLQSARVAMLELAVDDELSSKVLSFFVEELEQQVDRPRPLLGTEEVQQCFMCACDLLCFRNEESFSQILDLLPRLTKKAKHDAVFEEMIVQGLASRSLSPFLLGYLGKKAVSQKSFSETAYRIFDEQGHRAASVAPELVARLMRCPPQEIPEHLRLLSAIGPDAAPALREQLPVLKERCLESGVKRELSRALGKIFGAAALKPGDFEGR